MVLLFKKEDELQDSVSTRKRSHSSVSSDSSNKVSRRSPCNDEQVLDKEIESGTNNSSNSSESESIEPTKNTELIYADENTLTPFIKDFKKDSQLQNIEGSTKT